MTEDQWKWYQTAAEFYKNEMATLGWRTNVFIVAQSILVGSFILLPVNRSHFISWAPANAFLVFAIGIALVGLFYCIVQYLSGKSAATAAEFWRAYMYELEKSTKESQDNSEEYATWHALRKYYREKRHELRWFDGCKQSKAPPLYERDLLCLKPGPASWVVSPAIFGLAWLIAIGLLLFWIAKPCPSQGMCLWTIMLGIYIVTIISIVLRFFYKPQKLWRWVEKTAIRELEKVQ